MDRQKDSTGGGAAGSISHEVLEGTLWVRVVGSLDLTDVTAYVTRHQAEWASRDRILWDLRNFDPSGVTSNDILNIQHAFGEIMELRAGGRSAVVLRKELDLVVRVAMALREHQSGHIELRSFLDEAEAVAWLEAP